MHYFQDCSRFAFVGRYQIADDWPYKEARKMFQAPEVTPADQIPEFKWVAPDEEVRTWLGARNTRKDRFLNRTSLLSSVPVFEGRICTQSCS